MQFNMRVRFFKRAQKDANHLGFFGRLFVAKNFPKSPDLVTLVKRLFIGDVKLLE